MALTTNPQIALTLKKEKSYTPITRLDLHGLFLCELRKAVGTNGGEVPLMLNFGTRDTCVVSSTIRPPTCLYPLEKKRLEGLQGLSGSCDVNKSLSMMAMWLYSLRHSGCIVEFN